MPVRLLDIFLVPVFVLLLTVIPLHASDSHRKVIFAIITEKALTDDQSLEWVSAGISFELEKRLERCDGLIPVDRLKLNRVVKENRDISTLKTAIRKELDVDCIIAASTTIKDGKLSLQAGVTCGESQTTESTNASGEFSEFFLIVDRFTDSVYKLVQQAYDAPSLIKNCRGISSHTTKSVRAYGLMIQGKEAQQNGRMQDARKLLTQSLQIDTNLWWSHYFLGAVEFHEGQYQKAVEECLTAIRINPDLYPPVYANLSYCYKGLGDYRRAEQMRLEFERRSGRVLPDRPVSVKHR